MEVTGWGYVDKSSHSVQDLLQKAVVQALPRDKCLLSKQYTDDELDLGSFCASDVGIDTCQVQ